eukprot:TRINITY_DN4999_c0_g2_i1.p1 TRINITY_DN4999_c0_g2~~TRINITY_DN4999_c0_g2_i1.p1  ORF type:complete len:660 (+),score=117.39 TRINITY_DN4999_c0_g2_i1:65-1981(+)
MGLSGAVRTFSRALDRLSRREGDTIDDRRRRVMGIPVLVLVGLSAATAFILSDGAGRLSDIWFIGMSLTIGTAIVGVPVFLWSPLPTHLVAAVAVLCCAVALLCMDLSVAARIATRSWTGIVVAVDVCLVLHLQPWVQNTVICITLVYLAVERSEAAYRYGLYDAAAAPGTPDPCDCEAPPCKHPVAGVVTDYTVFLIVILTDFALTRGFATALRRQMAFVAGSVSVAEQVSAALVDFDLKAADAALSAPAGCALPARLSDSLRSLVHNLASYRPYLPQSCFVMDKEEDGPSCAVTTQTSMESVVSVWSSPPRRESGGSATRSAPGSALLLPAGLTASWSSRPRVQHAVQQRRVTLLGRNSSGLLAAPSLAEPAEVSAWLSAEISRFSRTLSAQGGMADVLSGDHMSASFGAVKAQGTQRASAVQAAVELSYPMADSAASGAVGLAALPVTVGVCSGPALCGDFGSSSVQRFMVIGGVGAFLPAIERAAAAWGAGALIDAAVHSDAEQSWHCRLRRLALFPKLSRNPIGLWEVMEARAQGVKSSEWMYELASAAPNPWGCYNAAVMEWCRAGTDGELRVASAAGDQELDGAVAAALRALQEHARAGAAAPQGPLPGDPAPVAAERADLCATPPSPTLQ